MLVNVHEDSDTVYQISQPCKYSTRLALIIFNSSYGLQFFQYSLLHFYHLRWLLVLKQIKINIYYYCTGESLGIEYVA